MSDAQHEVVLATTKGGSFNMNKWIAGLHDYLGKQLSPLVSRTKALEARIAVLEARLAEDDAKGAPPAAKPHIRLHADSGA